MCGVNLDDSGKNGSTSIKNELNEYLTYETKFPDLSVSEFWRTNCCKFKILTEYVKYYCIIPISSVKSESSFSTANFFQRKEFISKEIKIFDDFTSRS